MLRLRNSTPLIAAAAALLLVTGVVAAAVVLDSDDDASETDSAQIASTTATATSVPSTPAPTATADVPEGLPDDVLARLEELPQKLRDDIIERYELSLLSVEGVRSVIEEYDNRNQGVQVGSVIEATDSMLRLEIYATGERTEIAIDDETILRRGQEDIAATELVPEELVMVLSRDDGVTAFAITAFGVEAP